MSWSCRRPGCGEAASVVISYDTVACEVWVDHLDGAPDSAQLLCDRHRSRLSPPRGWTVLDRTGSAASEASDATAFTSADSTGAVGEPAGEPAGRRGWGQTDITSGTEFVGGPAAGRVALGPPEETLPEETLPEVTLPEVTLPEEPLPEVTLPAADVSDLLDPKGGLLGRAFRSTGHQRSVLTQEPSAE